MLAIRQEQMQAMQQASVEQFAERMLAHLKQFFPAKVDELGEKPTRDLIRLGMKQAAAHQITMERDVAHFIDLMLIICPDFDSNPATRWAGAILADRDLPVPRRLSRVQRAADGRGFKVPTGDGVTGGES